MTIELFRLHWHSGLNNPETPLGWKGAREKRGVRFIYYLEKASGIIYMLYVYPKNRQENLTPNQCKLLRQLVMEEFK